MAIIPIPATLSFTSVDDLILTRNTSILRSRFTGQRQAVVYPYAIWLIKAKLREYAPEDAGVIRSFLAQLDGQANTFRLPVPGYTQSLTGYTATRQLNVAAAVRASAVSVSGGSASSPYLLDGDYFTINDELKMAVGDIFFNAGGVAVINFKPFLRKPAIIGDNVVVLNPTMLMYAADDDVAKWGIRAPVIHSFDLDAIEAIDI